MSVTGRMVEEEHAALVAGLATLSVGQWRQPSLYAGWPVRDIRRSLDRYRRSDAVGAAHSAGGQPL